MADPCVFDPLATVNSVVQIRNADRHKTLYVRDAAVSDAKMTSVRSCQP